MGLLEKLKATRDLVLELEAYAVYLESRKTNPQPGKGFLLHHLSVVRETLEEVIKEACEKG